MNIKPGAKPIYEWKDFGQVKTFPLFAKFGVHCKMTCKAEMLEIRIAGEHIGEIMSLRFYAGTWSVEERMIFADAIRKQLRSVLGYFGLKHLVQRMYERQKDSIEQRNQILRELGKKTIDVPGPNELDERNFNLKALK